MNWFKNSRTPWLTVIGICALACGGMAEPSGAAVLSPSTGGATGAFQGGASNDGVLELSTAGGSPEATATGGAPSTSSIGGTTATVAPPAAVGGAPSKSCVYPVAPLPIGGVACPSNVMKGMACNNEGAVCYKPCGPAKSGWKSETCTTGVYADQDPSCPTISPIGAATCTVAPCTVCAGPEPVVYPDATGVLTTRWCVCVEADGVWKWSCGTAEKSWPCPQLPGC